MHLTRTVLSVAWVPLLSGCMAMGGLGHVGGMDGMAHAGHPADGRMPGPLQRAEASNGDLAIELSFPGPTPGVAVALEARLRTDGPDDEPAVVVAWLRVRAPSGRVDELRMEPLDASAAGTYRAQYSFPVAGRYLLTAEARVGTGIAARTVTVTTAADVGGGDHTGSHLRSTPAALLGGLAMVATMTLMMGIAAH